MTKLFVLAPAIIAGVDAGLAKEVKELVPLVPLVEEIITLPNSLGVCPESHCFDYDDQHAPGGPCKKLCEEGEGDLLQFKRRLGMQLDFEQIEERCRYQDACEPTFCEGSRIGCERLCKPEDCLALEPEIETLDLERRLGLKRRLGLGGPTCKPVYLDLTDLTDARRLGLGEGGKICPNEEVACADRDPCRPQLCATDIENDEQSLVLEKARRLIFLENECPPPVDTEVTALYRFNVTAHPIGVAKNLEGFVATLEKYTYCPIVLVTRVYPSENEYKQEEEEFLQKERRMGMIMEGDLLLVENFDLLEPILYSPIVELAFRVPSSTDKDEATAIISKVRETLEGLKDDGTLDTIVTDFFTDTGDLPPYSFEEFSWTDETDEISIAGGIKIDTAEVAEEVVLDETAVILDKLNALLANLMDETGAIIGSVEDIAEALLEFKLTLEATKETGDTEALLDLLDRASFFLAQGGEGAVDKILATGMNVFGANLLSLAEGSVLKVSDIMTVTLPASDVITEFFAAWDSDISVEELTSQASPVMRVKISVSPDSPEGAEMASIEFKAQLSDDHSDTSKFMFACVRLQDDMTASTTQDCVTQIEDQAVTCTCSVQEKTWTSSDRRLQDGDDDAKYYEETVVVDAKEDNSNNPSDPNNPNNPNDEDDINEIDMDSGAFVPSAFGAALALVIF